MSWQSRRKHSDGHILEVSKSQANQWITAMELCRQRIFADSGDELFGSKPFRLEVEIHFFLVALLRFYRSLSLAVAKLPPNAPLQERMLNFNEYIGIKRKMRNVGEHFDEYLEGRGHDDNIDSGVLQVWKMEHDDENVRFNWLGETFDLKRTMNEADSVWTLFLEASSVRTRGRRGPSSKRTDD